MAETDKQLIVDEPTANRFARFPVISLSAEYPVMGYLLRRNILTYKAPPGNEVYDLICIHPDPREAARQIRIQVKSRMASGAQLRGGSGLIAATLKHHNGLPAEKVRATPAPSRRVQPRPFRARMRP